MLKDNFKQRVLQVVSLIPYGKVTTYGEIAKQAGSPLAARQVGRILKKLPSDSTLPWFRVVNSYGKLSLTGDNYKRQSQRLMTEGVVFNQENCIDLSRFGVE